MNGILLPAPIISLYGVVREVKMAGAVSKELHRGAGSFLSRFFSPRRGQPLAGNGASSGGESEDAHELVDLARRLDEADLPSDVHRVLLSVIQFIRGAFKFHWKQHK